MASSGIVGLAIIGKNNEPLYLKEFCASSSEVSSEAQLFGLATTATTTSAAAADTTDTTTTSSSTPVSRRPSCSLRLQFIFHSALDRLEQESGPPPGFAWRRKDNSITGTPAMFVGLLERQDEYSVYGYMTTTQIKLLLAVETAATTTTSSSSSSWQRQCHLDKESIQQLIHECHQVYVAYVMNPFNEMVDNTSQPITNNPSFDRNMEQVVEAFQQQQQYNNEQSQHSQ